MINTVNESILPEVTGIYRFNVNMSKTNWFGVGGNADVVFKPSNTDDLRYFIKNIKLPYHILGVGSNVLIRDGGIRGIVIKFGKFFNKIEYKDGIISAGASVLCPHLAAHAENMSLTGLEFLSGIPGSIGGALAMNAGSYGGDIASILDYAEIIDDMGNIKYLTKDKIKYKYRENGLPKSWIFTKGFFKVKNDDLTEITTRMKNINTNRLNTQPIKFRTSGSTFKNPDNCEYKAWQLIDMAGCRGLKIGDAQVSEMHCNFFINCGKSTSENIEDLMQEVKNRVYNKFSIILEEEIKIIGEKL